MRTDLHFTAHNRHGINHACGRVGNGIILFRSQAFNHLSVDENNSRGNAMSDMNVNRMLAQMRAMSLEAGNKTQETSSNMDFSALLKQSINSANTSQQTAQKMAEAFETGESNASLAEVMIASQKASVSFQAMLQVRNKLVDAYKDIMNMPI
jgi:flagellar hook-basal body complex protein FliE